MHPADAAVIRDFPLRDGWADEDRAWLVRRGVPAAEHDELAPPASFAVRGRVDGADVLIEDGPSPLGPDDTLGTYLRSLSAMEDLDPEEVLPAHEYRFAGLSARVRQLQDHHRARLDEVVGVVAAAEGCTTFEVAERLTWSRPWDQSRGLVRRSAIGETYAHLFHLAQRGRLANTANPNDHWHVVRPTA
jgi:hypothetical protein